MNDLDYQVMEKFVDGGYAETDFEKEFVRELASLGFARRGFSSTPDPASFKETAILTSLGREKYLRERISRNFFRRLIHNVLNLY
jgi:hypothetical protein